MGITLFGLGGMLAPLRSLVDWLVHARSTLRGSARGHRPAAHSVAMRACDSWPTLAGSSREAPRRPLRVVRVMEACHTPASAGRMFISGCMADVCAELDRLAALEAAAG